jgi:RecB family exonuclease
MKPFVDRIADLLEEHQLDFRHTTIIVPSQRMISYLQAALFRKAGKPLLMPEMYTIDAWVQQLTPDPVIDPTIALFELFRIFQADPVEHEIPTFDAFLAWGQLLLNDFDEIDRYLVDPKQLFKNLRDVREIEQWSFNGDDLSKGQQKFMAFWDKLGPYYFAFEKQLKQLECTTKGKAYRDLATQIDRVFAKDPKRQFVFAGFNALSKAELSVFRQLTKMGRALVIMDSDRFYLDDKFHEAGQFQRSLLQELEVKELPFVANELTTKTAEVELVACAQVTGQANVIGSVLNDLNPNELNETLVLLADEQLLPSLLQHLPKSIGKANITLGLPLKQTALRLWVDVLFRIQENRERRGGGSIYFKDFIQLIHHPYIVAIADPASQRTLQELESKMIYQNWHFVDLRQIVVEGVVGEIFQRVFTSWKGDWKLALQLIQETNALFDASLTEQYTLEKSSIRVFSQSLVVLQNVLQESALEMTLHTFRTVFNLHWSKEHLAYFGNPLDGLQIMGLLETRGLDFKRILVLGLNEGKMPPTNPIQTLIPMDLRSFYGLPTPRDKQGLFAHHFYRLLHHAEKVLVTCAVGAEGIGGSEPSRYLTQLELELAQVNPEFKLTKSFYTLDNQEKIGKREVQKTPQILKRLDELLQDGLTYSKLNSFLECPLNFYYRYVLHIGEELKMEEEIESSTLGTIIHEVLEELYKPYVVRNDESGLQQRARQITPETYDRMIAEVPKQLDAAFSEHFSDDQRLWQTGTNHLNYVMSKETVLRVLRKEKQDRIDNPEKALFVEELESEYKVQTTVDVNGAEKTVTLHGFIDRIDRVDGKWRVLDYKSGPVSENKVKLSANKDQSAEDALLKLISDQKKMYDGGKHALQLLIYSYLLDKQKGIVPDEVGIFSFVTVTESPFALKLDENLTMSRSEIVEFLLQRIISDMYDTSEPFKHNSHSKYCKFCN